MRDCVAVSALRVPYCAASSTGVGGNEVSDDGGSDGDGDSDDPMARAAPPRPSAGGGAVTAAFGAKVDAFAAKPPRKRSRKPKPATAISFDPFALTPATPEQFEAAMKVYEGAMAPSAVPCRVVLDEPPCSLRATRAAVVTSACLPARVSARPHPQGHSCGAKGSLRGGGWHASRAAGSRASDAAGHVQVSVRTARAFVWVPAAAQRARGALLSLPHRWRGRLPPSTPAPPLIGRDGRVLLVSTPKGAEEWAAMRPKDAADAGAWLQSL
jgi:hypothetical protein